MKTVYLVECTRGDWDDVASWVAGVFEDAAQAELYAMQLSDMGTWITARQKELWKTYCETNRKEGGNKWHEWQHKYPEYIDWVGAISTPYVIGEKNTLIA